MMDRQNAAVIGIGYWGRKHVEEYVALDADVIAVDLNVENLKFCSEKYGVKTAKNYSDILINNKIKIKTVFFIFFYSLNYIYL